MIPMIVAMIVLQNVDPTPVSTPAASIGQRLTGSSPSTALQGLDTTSPFGSTTITVGCTYGTPRFGSSLLSNTNDLVRATTMPACTDPAGQSFAQPYATPMFVTSGRVVPFAPASFASVVAPQTQTTFSMNPRPTRSFAIQHLVVPTEFSGGAGAATSAQFHVTTNATRSSTSTPARHTAPATHTL